jgi:methionine-rich copper-binding protein CopC
VVRRCSTVAGLAAVLIAGLLAGSAGLARAHAIVLEASPAHESVLAAPPARIVLRFNSKIEHALSRVTIERGAGERGAGETGAGRPVALPVARAADGDAARLVVPLSPLAPGVYIVRYRVLAADGHVTEGALRFTIQTAP